jgi:predicted nucleic-acid-binding Zn-ribbon protein
MIKYHPYMSHQCKKCGEDSAEHSINHHDAVSEEQEQQSRQLERPWHDVAGPEHLTMHCKRCGALISKFAPMDAKDETDV